MRIPNWFFFILLDYNLEKNCKGVPMEGVKFGADVGNNNRRALRDIRNFVGVPPYPSALSKRGLQE